MSARYSGRAAVHEAVCVVVPGGVLLWLLISKQRAG